MDFFEVVNARRSVRSYRPDPVPHDVLERIVTAGIEAPSGCNEQLRRYVIVDDAELLERLRPASAALKGAPAAIVVLVEPKATKFGEFWIQDASAAMAQMLLAAVALGYAGCWIEGAIRRCEDDLRELLGVPPELRVWALMPVGKPAVDPPRPPKSDPADVVHHNRFGTRT
jgi:nitroreductase